ncbi:bifunctional metallophosphatase/5'-nucleotidase [Solimonas sp. K1W22B-7]|uniref:bifunctional metallophosphatase/5'-nucleotidase n=1 Tax=Solimonas sp. K1W22B-7 TaxID=2303331 RepID=UPI000E32E9AF|nr:bifunctional metallophosphatase/5'-nucleotidase [Solimonas sp. K1W22B-7]AXQ30374.1 bifunctional metallophosphatase/5'-nucleotidase [Solimonas sp. K1W22B-7]
MRALLFAALAALSLSACDDDNGSGAEPVTEVPAQATIKLIGLNDFHGTLNPPGNTSVPDPGDPTKTVALPGGGAAWLATLVAQEKAKNPLNVVVAAGDLIGATPLVSALFRDEPTIEALNLAGLEFSSVGNHEFDKGKAEIQRMQAGGCFQPEDSGTCQNGRFAGASYKYLAANVVDSATTRPLFPAYATKEFDVGGKKLKVGFIGLVLKETPTIVTPAGVAGLEFRDEAEAANAAVAELKAQGVRAIVVLIHQGAFTTGAFNDKSCPGVNGELLAILPKLDAEIDAVVSGHTHWAYLCKGKLKNDKEVPYTSAGANGRYLTTIDLTLDTASGDVVASDAKNLVVVNNTAPNPKPSSYPTVTPDAAVEALVARYNTLTKPLQDRLIGAITGDMTRAANTAGESALGDVIADAQLEATRAAGKGNAVAAFMNPGGIRADFVASQISGGEKAGEVTYGEAFTVQPFGNSLVTMTLTGAQIDTLLEQQFDNPAVGQSRFLQISAGFSYSWDNAAAVGAKVDPATIRINGVAVDPAASYRVTVNSFLATGGDRFFVLASGSERLGGAQDIDALVDYFRARTPLAPGPQNRITRLN